MSIIPDSIRWPEAMLHILNGPEHRLHRSSDSSTYIDYGPAPNNGAGFYKNIGGKELPNAPHFTTSLTADYTMPVSANWAATLHGDFYWQSQSWARVFNDGSMTRFTAIRT